jgi:hypothetical protein
MDKYIFKDFGKFDRMEFINKLREWEPYDVRTSNPHHPSNAAATAVKKDKKKFLEKLKKAKDGKYCVDCEEKDCYTKRLIICQEKSIRMGKTKCINSKGKKKTKANPTSVKESGDEEIEDNAENEVVTITTDFEMIPKTDYFSMFNNDHAANTFSVFFPGDKGYYTDEEFNDDSQYRHRSRTSGYSCYGHRCG